MKDAVRSLIATTNALNMSSRAVQLNTVGVPADRGFWFEDESDAESVIETLTGILPAIRDTEVTLYLGAIGRRFAVLPTPDICEFRLAGSLIPKGGAVTWEGKLPCHEFGESLFRACLKLGIKQDAPLVVDVTEKPAEKPAPKMEITLSESQQSAINLCLHRMEIRGSATFITGKAGTGKSTILREIRKVKKLQVLAPTGLAALNVGGSTIHSFFGIKPGAFSLRNQQGLSDEKKKALLGMDALVFDEISMVRPDLLDLVDTSLRRTLDKDLPFGGIPVIFFGDLWQLPPVVANDAEKEYLAKNYRSHFFFDAKCLSADAHPDGVSMARAELTDVFRQSDPTMINALNQVRTGNPAGLEIFNSRVGAEIPEGAVYLTFTKKKAESINKQNLEHLESEVRTYNCTTDGDIGGGELPTDRELQLAVGAQVMFIKNIRGLDGDLVANGSVGHVTRLESSMVWVELNDGREVIATPETWESKTLTYNEEANEVEEKVLASFTQIPLKLAWAITTHKSQGQTLDAAYIVGDGVAFSHGLAYVALSRVKSLNGLSLMRRLTAKDLQVNPQVTMFESLFGLGGAA